MIKITKSEAELIRSKYPNAEIVRTCIQKSKRHRYYLAESRNYLVLIADSNSEAAQIVAEMNSKYRHKVRY